MQVQNRFVTNKFIPLEKRESLIEKIKSIRSTYIAPKKSDENWFSQSSLISVIASILGALAAIFGALSIARKNELDRQTEIDIAPADLNHNGRFSNTTPLEFEKTVGDVLNDLGELISHQMVGHDCHYDFEVRAKNINYIVEVKNYKKLLGLSTVQNFIHEVNKSRKKGILIVSSGFTERTKQIINEHNKLSENHEIYLVAADNKIKLREQLQKILLD